MASWQVPLLLVFLIQGSSQFPAVDEACQYLQCSQDGGTPTVQDGNCFCHCLPDYTGLLCETKIEEGAWPNGEYATPMSIYGCPEDKSRNIANGWTTGYLNMTFKQNVTRHAAALNTTIVNSRKLSLLGPYSDFVIQMNFCYMKKLGSQRVDRWPKGKFNIYRAGKSCPLGFDESVFKVELPPLLNHDVDGDIPDILLSDGDSAASLTFYMCEKQFPSRGTFPEPTFAFILMKGVSQDDDDECLEFPDLVVKKEELSLVSLTYCSYVPSSEDILQNQFLEPVNQTMNLTWDLLDPVTFTVNYPFNDVKEVHNILQNQFLEPVNQTMNLTWDLLDPVTFTVNYPFNDVKEVHTGVHWIRVDLLYIRTVDRLVFKIAPISVDLSTVDQALEYQIRNNVTQEHFPEVFCCPKKWSFLKNGCTKRLGCIWKLSAMGEDWLLYLECIKFKLQSRYFVIVVENFNQTYNELLIHFLNFKDIRISQLETEIAHHGFDLGMEDGRIEDFQITASTHTRDRPPHVARPQLKGWCALLDDAEPFIQVNLLAATVVSGIKIYNWNSTFNYRFRNTYMSDILREGLELFIIKYGYPGQPLLKYTKANGSTEIKIDESLPYLAEQTFLFHKSILASVIQIHPRRLPGITDQHVCMRFELLGTAQTISKTVMCDSEDKNFWTVSQDVFVSPASLYAPAEVANTSITDCKETCETSQTDCVALMFDYQTKTCSMYTRSARHIYVRAKEDVHSLYQFMCLKDYKDLNASIERVDDTLIVLSAGYPTAPIGTTYTISVEFPQPDNKFMQIMVTNISTDNYMIQRDSQKHDVSCQEKILIGGEKVLASQNHIIFPFNTTAVVIDQETCWRGTGVKVINFRIIFRLTELPWCKPSKEENSPLCEDYESHKDKAVFISNSYRGIPYKSRLELGEFWNIKGDFEYILLNITSMFVSCNSGSRFIIKFTRNEQENFCNGRISIGTLMSKNMRLIIFFEHSSHSLLHEGFMAQYEKRKYKSYNEDSKTYGNVTIEGGFDRIKVCRPKKCYYFFRALSPEETTWLTATEADQHCEATGSTLVHITSEYEDNFLKYYIHRHVANMSETYADGKPVIGPDKELIGHAYIGLVRYYANGKMHMQWTNGKPVSYSSWTHKHPGIGLSRGRCTRLGVFTHSDANTWEAVRCKGAEGEKARYFVCETKNSDGEEIYEGSLHDRLGNQTGDIHGDEYRYFECRNFGEFVSILFRCDGLMDCLDGSDEVNCTSSRKPDGSCRDGFFRCNSGECVPISACCDTFGDCRDRSDEHCEAVYNPYRQYRCASGQYVARTQVCDGIPDCLDHSDERYCREQCPGMFHCRDSDQTCIPLDKECDGFSDCPDGRDEATCGVTCLSSCREWWERGFHESGEYCVEEKHRVECNFDTENVIKTIYYDIEGNDLTLSDTTGIDVVYKSLSFVERLVNRLTCRQSITHTCRPPTSLIAQQDGIGNNRGLWHCFCVRWVFSENKTSSIEPCSDETAKEAAYQENGWLHLLAPEPKPIQDFPVTNIVFNTNTQPYENVIFENITCEEELNMTDVDRFICKRRNFVSVKNQCLYQLHMRSRGLIKGCADMSHLQGCEDIECPNGFIKCPSSFCIPIHFLCDGTKQCPDGNDEFDCWCGNNSFQVSIIFPTSDDELYNTMITMATQFYQKTENRTYSNVRLLRYRYQRRIRARALFNVRLETITAEMEQFHPRTYKQLTDPLATGDIKNVMSRLTNDLSNYGDNEIKIVLTNVGTYDPYLMRELFRAGFTSTERLYLAYVGEDIYNDLQSLPEGIHYVHVQDGNTPSPFVFKEFAAACPPPKSPKCAGMYRCHASRVCIQLSSVCDGFPHCPHRDDERLCTFTCPKDCNCTGYSVDCSENRASDDTLIELSNTTRSLNLNDNNIHDTLFVVNLSFMITLNMSRCNLKTIPANFIQGLTNLKFLDLSFNALERIRTQDLLNKRKLEHINLEGNPRLRVIEKRAFEKLGSMRSLVIRETDVETIEEWTFSEMKLDLLDLSKNRLTVVKKRAFGRLSVKALNISGNKINNFQDDMLKNVQDLEILVTDSYRFCCIKPSYLKEENCKPERDEFSSCADLMRNEILRFLIWFVGCLALVGNILSLIYRLIFDRKRLQLGYGIFVTNLAISDFMMGVYLVTIAIADQSFRGIYILKDEWWRHSFWCNVAGVIATMSSEASVLFMCFITLDRLIVIKYPTGDIRFKTKSAIHASILVWLLVLFISCLPLMWTSYFQNQFYSQSGVCLALPLTRKSTKIAGSLYSVAIFIVFNFVSFLLIGFGQFFIYRELKRSKKVGSKTAQDRETDLKVARNLLMVVMTDFLCWFPLGIMGLLALRGQTISGVVYSWAAVVILPVNSALNPFLYTFTAIVGKKKFNPDVDEQERALILSPDEVDGVLELWNKGLFLQDTDIWDDLVPISSHMTNYRLTPREILVISERLTRTISKLHNMDLITNGFSVDDVYVRTNEDERVTYAIVALSPSLIVRKKERQNDISDIGEVLNSLLMNIEKQGDGEKGAARL